MIVLDCSENFFKQPEINKLKSVFKNSSKKKQLFFEIGVPDEFSRFELPSQFFFEKIISLFKISDESFQISHANIKFDEIVNNLSSFQIAQTQKKNMFVKLKTLNPCMIYITPDLMLIHDEEKRVAHFELPFVNIFFINSVLKENKKSIFRIVLQAKNTPTGDSFDFVLHRVFLLLGDFFNLKTF